MTSKARSFRWVALWACLALQLMGRDARAQSAKPGLFELGIKVGATTSSIQWQYQPCPSTPGTACSFRNELRRTAQFGAFAAVLPTPHLGVELQLLYVKKGDDVQVNTVEHHFTYLEVPLQLRLTAGHGQFHVYGWGGGSPAFQLQCSTSPRYIGAPSLMAFVTTTECESERPLVDFGLTGAIGMGYGPLTAEMRLTHGLANVWSRDIAQNRTLSVAIRWKLIS